MRRLAIALLLALFAALVSPAGAQNVGGGTQTFTSWAPTGRAALSVTSTTARVAFATPGPTALICNTGAVDAFLAFGGSTINAVAATGWKLTAGACLPYNLQPFTGTTYSYVAAITASSTTTLYIETGLGTPQVVQAAPGASGLPAGAATSANQTTQITAEQAIQAGVGAVGDTACATASGSCSVIALQKFGNTAFGAPADAAWTSGNGSLIAILKAIAGSTAAALPAGTADIGNVGGRTNVTPADCSGTITAGGTAQNAFAAQATLRGMQIQNIDIVEGMWISFTTTAAASTAASFFLPPASATTMGGAYNTPFGFGFNTALSVIAATTGHKFSCTRW